ncbi:MAG TPA: hypothetical protein VLM42_06860 [Bryobacteraceae bacterium]|nr:hypothetical protein [Bryobacteraceae bacterium]
MTAKCPRCGNHTGQGTDYAGTLKLAEAGEVKFYCVYCGVQWQPDPDEQKKDCRQHTRSDRGSIRVECKNIFMVLRSFAFCTLYTILYSETFERAKAAHRAYLRINNLHFLNTA